ncbi:unnamed protein product [Malus baccata var. baccata]
MYKLISVGVNTQLLLAFTYLKRLKHLSFLPSHCLFSPNLHHSLIYAINDESLNSKLSHLLQDSLGGDSKTLMFVQISPNENDVSETLCSLNFASRVRGIELGQAKRQLDTSELLRYKQMEFNFADSIHTWDTLSSDLRVPR